MEKKTYKNISTVTQLGIAPGETGERAITKEKQERLEARGAIEEIGKTSPSQSQESAGMGVPGGQGKK